MSVTIHVHAAAEAGVEVRQGFYKDESSHAPLGWIDLISDGQEVSIMNLRSDTLERLGYAILDAAHKARAHEARLEVAKLADAVAAPA